MFMLQKLTLDQIMKSILSLKALKFYNYEDVLSAVGF